MRVTLETSPTVRGWPVDDWDVMGALVPKPEKVRLPVDDLVLSLMHARILLQKKILGGKDVHYGMRFTTGVEYVQELPKWSLNAGELNTLLRSVSLPRHAGVVSLFHKDTHLCDLVMDVTEVCRDVEKPPVIVMVAPGLPPNSAADINARKVARRLDWAYVGSVSSDPL